MGEDMERAVEMVRRGYEAFNGGDFDAAIEMMHPEIEWQRVAPFEQPLRGREAVREFFQPEVFRSQRSEIFEVTPIGEHVLVHARFHGAFAGSGMELTQDGFHLWRIRDGLAVEFRYFVDRDEAVRAAGADA